MRNELRLVEPADERPYLTWLYAPGDRPQVVAKALAAGADVVIVDLEDAVAPDRKQYAREATVELLTEPRPASSRIHVRINALGGPLARQDVEALVTLPGLAGLRLPKVEHRRDVLNVAEWAAEARLKARVFGMVPLYALIESALGVENAYKIACAHSAVRGIALGEADLSADLGTSATSGLAWPRSRTIVAARAALLPPPAQSVYADVRDTAGLAESCAEGRTLGFLGRAAIHPRQLEAIRCAYLPTSQEIDSAREITEAAQADSGALALPDGRFVDAAVVAGARRTLLLAEWAAEF
ncbi:CoA ester lyase [Streptomyces sp. N35]|uniref:HpcH/HpaI aldolase/citrate lyase family protein n=1 Tax=Streptomyces sp. N35 TaxID=2795730 RepID=UPI0027DD88D9|nr:CoA ester lyase [Streptomyces sp. N35]